MEEEEYCAVDQYNNALSISEDAEARPRRMKPLSLQVT
jgi:hypothetical protein